MDFESGTNQEILFAISNVMEAVDEGTAMITS